MIKVSGQGTASSVRSKPKETWIEQSASFIGFFIYLLILKSFFLPLFIIPTGSMAETLYGAHALHTCPNCGTEYAVGWQPPPPQMRSGPYHPTLQCPNCRWTQYFGSPSQTPPPLDQLLSQPLRSSAGDRIFVHGWTYETPFRGLPGLGPARWDVVVFKVPSDGQTNYIKRLIGLPGEEIEIIDGDIFVNGELTSKTQNAQKSLWFPYYDHDRMPRQPALHKLAPPAHRGPGYYPRWVALDPAGWSEVETRAPVFDGLERSRGELQFVTATDPGSTAPGLVQDVYGYNEPPPRSVYHTVTDVRLSAQLTDLEIPAGGSVELSTTKGARRFAARLGAGGRLDLLHAARDTALETWATTQVRLTDPLRVALAHVDGTVIVEVDGEEVLRSTPTQYSTSPAEAREHSADSSPPILRFAAERARVRLQHVLIERDVYYTSNGRLENVMRYGVQGRPIRLDSSSYFMLGDNSPNSQDARYAFSRDPSDPVVGPHLQGTDYPLGTVPGDQLIGRAFLVYWPGFLPVTPWGGVNFLPDAGRIRWIH